MNIRTCLPTPVLACEFAPPPGDGPPPGDAPPPIVGYPAEVGACLGEPTDPTRLLVTTTDFATGGVSVVELAAFKARPDLAVGSTDARPRAAGDLALVLHRYGLDALDVLASDDLHLLAQRAIEAPGDAVSANPHDVVLAPDGLAYVTLFGAPEVQVWDLARPDAPVLAERVNIAAVADADGDPEAAEALLCGDVLFFFLDRVDREHGLVPADPTGHVAALDRRSGALYDFDPKAPGVQPLALRGQWARQWRLDPADPSGRTALILTTGVERLDLATGALTWAVAPERLAALGIDQLQLPQAFDLGPGDDHVYLAAYRPDFSEVAVYRADLDLDTPLVEVLSGLQSVEQTLEVIGDVLYFGDRNTGLRAWDLAEAPPRELPGSPLDLGLAPYAAAPLP